MSLPDAVFSHLGMVPVSVQDVVGDDGRMGEWDHRPRVIRVQSGNDPAAQCQALWHETAHVVLWDAGAHNLLTDKQMEVVCDAFGTWFAAAVAAGYLTVSAPR